VVVAHVLPQWQIQEAKQRLSEVLRRVAVDGPQAVTRHGQEIAVIIDMAEYRRLTGQTSGTDLIDFLTTAPDLDGLDLERDDRPARDVDLTAEP
jgi:prevent-host-death family protein